MHKWRLDEKEYKEWFIECTKESKEFSPKEKCFDESGRCPFCGANAKKELDERKKRKQQYNRDQEERERQLNKNTLLGYF